MDNYLVEIADAAVRVVMDVVVSVAVPAALAWLLAKVASIGIQVSEQRKAQIQGKVADVLAEVEEMASARVKAGIPVTSAEKLEAAIAGIIARIKILGFVSISPEKALSLVHQVLPRLGLGAAAFLRDLDQKTEGKEGK